MNAVIALCHFCEAHGPCSIFCTQTLRDTKIEDVSFEHHTVVNCPACNSTGLSTAIISQDPESNASFVSTQVPVIPEVASLVKQASVRSLSCEISCNKDGGFVFFGDASRGHVLSHTFHISDVQARGFYQLFSIIILMKDKYFLVNIQPFLSENLQKISQELQSFAQNVYDQERLNSSPRERRMSGNQSFAPTPRSLTELTAEENVFAILHSHFTWILLAGSRYLTEHVTFNHLPWSPSNINTDIVQISKRCSQSCADLTENEKQDHEHASSLRYVKGILESAFIPACYCTLTGTKVLFRGPIEKCNEMASCLSILLPEKMHTVVRLNCPDDVSAPDARIITVSAEVAVPLPSPSIFRIDFLENQEQNISVKWPGELPNKWPTLLQKVVKAVDETLFTDSILNKHISALKEEWKNKIICLSKSKPANNAELKKVLGILAQDMPLVTYWSPYLQA